MFYQNSRNFEKNLTGEVGSRIQEVNKEICFSRFRAKIMTILEANLRLFNLIRSCSEADTLTSRGIRDIETNEGSSPDIVPSKELFIWPSKEQNCQPMIIQH
jgi:hypothetical protein